MMWISTLVGLGMAIWMSYRCACDYSNVLASKNWIETSCRVIESGLGADDELGFPIKIKYRYVFNEKEFVSDRYDLVEDSVAPYRWKQSVIDKYPVGSEAVCFVYPPDPRQAVLTRGWTRSVSRSLGILAFVSVTAWGVFSCGVFRLRQMYSDGETESPEVGWQPLLARSAQGDGSTAGLLQLRPVRSRFQETLIKIVKRVPVLVFALIAFILLYLFVVELGVVIWFTLILLLSLICDLFRLGYSGVKLALWSLCPRPRIRANTAIPSLGGSIDVEWSLTGGLPRVRRLKILLKGSEQTKMKEGKRSKRVRRETFAEVVIADTTDARKMMGGRQSVAIPKNAVPSMEFGKSSITWSIEVNLDVLWWPKPAASFPLCVMPVSCHESAT